MKKNRKNKWKQLPFNSNESAPEFISFEELVDYTIVRGQEIENNNEDDKTICKKRTKRKNYRKKFSDNISGKRKMPNDTNCSLNKKQKITDPLPNDVQTSSVDDVNPDLILNDMCSWSSFNLPIQVIKALALKKFTQPTEIQKLALSEAIINKKDILGAAETGSGKTLAFAIPIVSFLLQAEKNNINIYGTLWALIVTPTRELTIQVKNHIQELCTFTNIKVQAIVGGLSVQKQNRKLNEKPHIIVGTPGRLWELIRSGHNHLSKVENIKFFVVDEADRIFEKNHFDEFTYLLERLKYSSSSKIESSKHRQTFIFSATLTLIHKSSYTFKIKKEKKKRTSRKFTSEGKLQSFIDSLNLKNPAILDLTTKNILASGISEQYISCSVDEKDYYLYYLLKIHSGKKIVFTNSVNCVKRLHRLLSILLCNPNTLFADMAQNQRLKNLDKFQKNPNGLLLATDVAARGLDIPNIDYIIHYQVPKTSEVYVHRSGRSVRGSSARGTSIILCSPVEYYHYNKIRNTLGKDNKLPSYLISDSGMFLYAKQIINIGKRIEEIETKMRCIQTNVNWFKKCANDMDILLDEEEISYGMKDDTKRLYQREIKKLRAQLKEFLSKPVFSRYDSLRYPKFETVQSYLKQIDN